jgi:hypothetical protein
MKFCQPSASQSKSTQTRPSSWDRVTVGGGEDAGRRIECRPAGAAVVAGTVEPFVVEADALHTWHFSGQP